jgi:hypothetical protein
VFYGSLFGHFIRHGLAFFLRVHFIKFLFIMSSEHTPTPSCASAIFFVCLLDIVVVDVDL